MLKEKNQNLELRHGMKRAGTFSGPEESSISMRSWLIKRPQKEEIYHSTDYANFRSFYHQIESGSEGWTPNKRYKKTKRLLAIEEVDSWEPLPDGKERLRRLGCPQRFSRSTFRRSRPSGPYFMARLSASQKNVQWVGQYIPTTIQYPQNTDWGLVQRSC